MEYPTVQRREMAPRKEPAELTTEVWGLNFFVRGAKVCFVVCDPAGKQKRFWAKMTPRMSKAVNECVNDYLEDKAADAALTPQQLAKKYEECMGS
jgi:hypothetical protein